MNKLLFLNRLSSYKKELFSKRPSFPNRLSAHEKELFVKRLSFLLKAGVPILQSLTMIKEQTRSKFQKKIIESLMHSIANGQTIHAGLKRFRNIFGDFIINVIRIGENTGFLHQNLNYLAEELKKRRILNRKIIGALVYPIFVALATITITTLLIVFVFPKILPILTSLNVPLPITTRILIAVSSFLTHHGLFVLLGLIVFIVAMIFVLKVPKVQIFINNVLPLIPIFGQLLQNYHLANISRTLGVLLKGNVTLTEAIKITAETTPNIVYKKILEDIGENI
jgi:type II secretory pathway component PulF